MFQLRRELISMFFKRTPYLLIIFLFLLAVLGWIAYANFKNFNFEKIIQTEIVKKQVGEKNQALLNLAPKLLGFDQPRTYLLLFENNTELRPAGGFIGVYAVVKMDKGQMELVALEGTETLDKKTPDSWKPVAPTPISEHLKVDRWYFRDSNWSPDFSESAKKALEFYQGECGASADQIETIIAFTPTVLEELMKITGPFNIQGIDFSADNVTEKLEYEVEYGYDDKGIVREERKQIIKPFMLALLSHLKDNLFFKFTDYFALAKKMGAEKQLLAYSLDEDMQAEIEKRGWDGRVLNVDGDYLLWVDANLAALKTDHAIVRTLNYSLEPQSNGRYLAIAEMVYEHKGKFDWRTTRYRTYARVFVPAESELISVDGADQGEELGKKWFGAFISIEPGKTGTLRFSYLLPLTISEQIKNNSYNLLVQKQLGTIASGLTLSLDSGKNINGVYKYSGDLRVDREFEIKF